MWAQIIGKLLLVDRVWTRVEWGFVLITLVALVQGELAFVNVFPLFALALNIFVLALVDAVHVILNNSAVATRWLSLGERNEIQRFILQYRLDDPTFRGRADWILINCLAVQLVTSSESVCFPYLLICGVASCAFLSRNLIELANVMSRMRWAIGIAVAITAINLSSEIASVLAAMLVVAGSQCVLVFFDEQSLTARIGEFSALVCSFVSGQAFVTDALTLAVRDFDCVNCWTLWNWVKLEGDVQRFALGARNRHSELDLGLHVRHELGRQSYVDCIRDVSQLNPLKIRLTVGDRTWTTESAPASADTTHQLLEKTTVSPPEFSEIRSSYCRSLFDELCVSERMLPVRLGVYVAWLSYIAVVVPLPASTGWLAISIIEACLLGVVDGLGLVDCLVPRSLATATATATRVTRAWTSGAALSVIGRQRPQFESHFDRRIAAHLVNEALPPELADELGLLIADYYAHSAKD